MTKRYEPGTEDGGADRSGAPASAAEWYVALDSNAPGEADSARFSAWLAQSGEHEAELARCSAAAELGARLRDDPELRWAYDEAAAIAARETTRPRHAFVAVVRGAARFFSPLRLVSAAALLAAVGIAVLILDFGGNPPTPAGGAGGARTASRAAQIMSGLPAADPAAVLPGRVFVDSGSVAVLPFAAPSGSDASGVSYRDFATDLYRGVVAELRALPAVYVVAAPSVYGSAGLAPWEIGAQLGTRGIVTGSVEVVDDSVAMAMTLRDAATNAVLWEMRYEQPLGDAVAVRADVVEHIATALVDPEQRARAAAVDARADNRVTSVPPAIAASE